MSSKKILCLFLSILMLISLTVACGQNNTGNTSNDANTGTTDSNNTTNNTNDANDSSDDVTETKIGDVTFTYWVPMHSQAVKILENYGENEVYKKLEEITGVKIEFLHPASGQETEQLNLMIASKDLPDIIESFSYTGGLDKAIEDNVIISLNDLMEHAPNYQKLRESHEDIAAETMTDNGNIAAFYCIQNVEEPPWLGGMIRKDYLDELGLDIPKTIADWENVLKAFKDKGIEVPLHYNIDSWQFTSSGLFVSAYGIGPEFYNDNGQVKFGPIEPGYKDFITLMAKWYEEGLLDQDFASRDDNNTESMILNGDIAAWAGAYESFDYYENLAKPNNPDFKLAPVPSPSLNEGETVEFRQKNYFNKGTTAVITTACENPEEAVKWFDYHYSDEGSMLFNWGIEGVSYEMVDGEPKFTDLMTNNPDGLSYITLAHKYKLHMGPYLRDYEAFVMTDTIYEAMDVWGEAGSAQVIPMITMTLEENKEYSSIMSDINTYIQENRIKFIMGIEPMENFDKFVEQIKSMNIERAIAIQQAALDRYMSRK
ncbi:MAG: extracellular solute-binding protein [Caldicoprobacterales bacterium]